MVGQYIPAPEKDGKVRICIDYRYLNKASPKDDFPLLCIGVLVAIIAGHTLFSFMDGFSSYNRIWIALEDHDKTSFITPWSASCYKVMPLA